MVYVYLVISAVLVPILNNFYPILKESYSWWLVPLLIIGFFLALSALHIVWLILSFAFVNVNSDNRKCGNYYRFVIKHSLPLILSLARVKINVTGKSVEDIPTDRKMLFVCNHQHDFDPIIIWSVFPENEIGFIGKKEIYKTMPFVAKVMHKLYGLPIDRENNREGAKTIIKAINFIKEDKASIALFPEGYTSLQCELLPFRNGAFKIALKPKAPIVVCALNGTRNIPKRMIWHGCTVDFKILDIIYPEDYEGMNTNDIGDKIHLQMEEALKELRNK